MYARSWTRLSWRHRVLTEALVAVRGKLVTGGFRSPAARRLPWAFRAAVALACCTWLRSWRHVAIGDRSRTTSGRSGPAASPTHGGLDGSAAPG